MTEMSNVAAFPASNQAERQALMTMPMGEAGALAPQTFGQALEWAHVMCQSSLVPTDMRGNPADVVICILWGSQLGMSAVQSLQNIAVINGRASLWGDVHLAIVRGRASGQLKKFKETWDPDLDGGTWTTLVQRNDEDPVERTFSVNEAKKVRVKTKNGVMALAEKDTWQNYPRRMCKFKARNEALRDTFPDILMNIATREEADEWVEAEVLSVDGKRAVGADEMLGTLDQDLADSIVKGFDALSLSRAERLVKLREFKDREERLLDWCRDEYKLRESRGAKHAPPRRPRTSPPSDAVTAPQPASVDAPLDPSANAAPATEQASDAPAPAPAPATTTPQGEVMPPTSTPSVGDMKWAF